MKDLAVLVADKEMKYAVKGILARPKALGIRNVDHVSNSHVGFDGAVRATGPDTLSLLRNEARHGILMLDFKGSGSDKDAIGLEGELNQRLALLWGDDRAKAIVIDPELETWIWGSDNALIQLLDWKATKGIRPWLQDRGFKFNGRGKPFHPKAALEKVLYESGERRSSTLYEKIMGMISLNKCRDPAFLRLKTILQTWFPSATS